MDIVAQLEEWSSINSYSHHSAGLEKMLVLAQEAFSELNPDSLQLLPFGLSLCKRPEAEKRIFLGGHLDTVFPPDHPFQSVTRLDTDRLQGPGVLDMKGGILIMLHALRAFEASRESRQIGWEIFLNLDEEIGSPSSTPFLEMCAARCDYALLFEPALPDGSFVSGRKGSANYQIISRGKAAHAGRHPEEGVNAIYPLARLIIELESLNTPDTLINVGKIAGGGPLNTIPDYAEAGVNVRFRKAVESLVREKVEQSGLSLRRLSYRPAKPFDTPTQALFSLLKECGETLKIPVKWRETGGVCDGNTFGAAGVPTIDTLGAVGDGAHTDQEFVFLSSLSQKARLTTELLKKLARSVS